MTRKKNLRDFLENVSEKFKKQICRSYEIIGDIAIVEVKDESKKYQNEIAKAIFKLNKNVKSVFKKAGIHQGKFRILPLEFIGGDKKDWTIYKENGVRLYIEPGKVYFSQRLSTERELVLRDLDKKRVLVMFSGAGPYSFVGYKKNPNVKNITSVEINPLGTKFALKSKSLNKSIGKKTKLYEDLIKFVKKYDLDRIFKYQTILTLVNQYKLSFIESDVKAFVNELNQFKNVQNVPESIFFKLSHKKKFVDPNSVNGVGIPKKNNLFIALFKLIKTKENIIVNQLITQTLYKINNARKSINVYRDDVDTKDEAPYKFEELKLLLILFRDYINIALFDESEIEEYRLDTPLLKTYFIETLFDQIFSEEFDEELTLNEIIQKYLLSYDVIYMPLPKDASEFLDSAFKVSKKGTKIYMYDFVKEEDIPKTTIAKIKKEASKYNYDVEVKTVRKVGQYSPKKYRVCAEFTIK